MSRTVTLAPLARDDLIAARAWLTQSGAGPAAFKRLIAILVAIERLVDYPCRFPIGVHPNVRERLCAKGYRILYEVRPDTGSNESAGDVRVLRIYGPGQDRSTFGSREY